MAIHRPLVGKRMGCVIPAVYPCIDFAMWSKYRRAAPQRQTGAARIIEECLSAVYRPPDGAAAEPLW